MYITLNCGLFKKHNKMHTHVHDMLCTCFHRRGIVGTLRQQHDGNGNENVTKQKV